MSEENEVKSYGSIYGEDKGTGYAGNVWDKEQLCPTLNTMQGGNREPLIVAMRGREDGQQLEAPKEVTNTLTSVQKDNLVIEQEPISTKGKKIEVASTILAGYERTNMTGFNADNGVVQIKQATEKGYVECDVGGVADLSYPTSKTRRGRVQEHGQVSPALTVSGMDGINRIEKVGQISNDGSQYGTVLSDEGLSGTLQAGTHGYANNCIANEYRIRKLTPLECWRLMGFTDEEFHKAEEVNSNTQLYKQAGNSIVVDVLEAIFRELMEVLDMESKTYKIEDIQTDMMIDLVKFREKEPKLFEELCKDYPVENKKILITVV
jgi:DNA (cytosine-5)-methyltransferase 1